MSTDWQMQQRIDRARHLKATTLAYALRDGGFTAETAARLDTDGRHKAEDIAGTRPKSGKYASDETWRIVIETLARSERERALCAFCGIGNPDGEPGPRKAPGHEGECSK